MSMVKSRSLTSHTYNEDTAKEIAKTVTESYYKEFIYLKERLDAILKR